MKNSLMRGERGRILLVVMFTACLPAIELTALATVSSNIATSVDGLTQPAWLFSGYVLAQALAVPLSGKVADSMGRRPAILIGIAVFMAASLLCGIAWAAIPLIVGRTLQGAGAGIIMTSSNTIIADIFDVRDRGQAAGYIATVWALGALVGPAIGALFVTHSSWRWLFFINLPLGAISIWFFLKHMQEPATKRGSRQIDLAGITLMAVSASALMIALNEGGVRWAWDSAMSLGLFTVSIVALLALLSVERRVAEPVMPLWVFRSRIRLSCYVTGSITSALYLALSIYLPIYAQTVQGRSASEAGLIITGMALGWPVGCLISSRLYVSLGFRPTVLIGGAVIAIGMVPLAMITPETSLLVMALCGIAAEIGFGFAATTSMVAEQTSVRYAERGVAMGVGGLVRSLGQVMGTAGFGAIVTATAGGVVLGSSHGTDDGLAVAPEVMGYAVQVVFLGCLLAVVPFMLGGLLMPTRIVAPFDDTNPWVTPTPTPAPPYADGGYGDRGPSGSQRGFRRTRAK
jgi:MFS family permease